MIKAGQLLLTVQYVYSLIFSLYQFAVHGVIYVHMFESGLDGGLYLPFPPQQRCCCF